MRIPVFVIVFAALIIGLVFVVEFCGSSPIRGEGLTEREYVIAEFPWQAAQIFVVEETLEEYGDTKEGKWFRGFCQSAKDGKKYRFRCVVGQNRGGLYAQFFDAIWVPDEYLKWPIGGAK